MIVSFSVPGKPVPKARPRVIRRGNRVITFTPSATREYQRAVGLCANLARPKSWPMDSRYRVTIEVFGAHGNSDVDNVAKSILDGCENILWSNDRLVQELKIMRSKGNPRVFITAETVEL